MTHLPYAGTHLTARTTYRQPDLCLRNSFSSSASMWIWPAARARAVPAVEQPRTRSPTLAEGQLHDGHVRSQLPSTRLPGPAPLRLPAARGRSGRDHRPGRRGSRGLHRHLAHLGLRRAPAGLLRRRHRCLQLAGDRRRRTTSASTYSASTSGNWPPPSPAAAPTASARPPPGARVPKAFPYSTTSSPGSCAGSSPGCPPGDHRIVLAEVVLGDPAGSRAPARVSPGALQRAARMRRVAG